MQSCGNLFVAKPIHVMPFIFPTDPTLPSTNFSSLLLLLLLLYIVCMCIRIIEKEIHIKALVVIEVICTFSIFLRNMMMCMQPEIDTILITHTFNPLINICLRVNFQSIKYVCVYEERTTTCNYVLFHPLKCL